MTTHYRRPSPPLTYPAHWNDLADVRVLRARPDEWPKLSTWRRDMTRRGWALLRVTTTDDELTAVFGKTKAPDSKSS
jgi:hypothetical protein